MAVVNKETEDSQIGKPTLVLLHGIGRSYLSMKHLESRLKKAGYQVINIGYPSLRKDIPGCSRYLREIIKDKPAHSLVFIVHSMGGLVLRQYIQFYGEEQIEKIIFLGTPHQGSRLAKQLKPILRPFLGPAIHQLADAEYACKLPIPHCKFLNIAGGNGTKFGMNPLFGGGDNDFIVGFEEAQLPGAHQFIRVRHYHAFLMNGSDTLRHILEFLKS
jgi:pimeloyl-ACP methyl ester carboxylesterase